MQVEYSSDSDSASGEEWADMLDEEEQKYILNRLAKQPQLLSNVPEENSKEERKWVFTGFLLVNDQKARSCISSIQF